MKTLLLFLVFFLMSFSLKTEPKIEKIWVASINLYLEDDELVLYYKGKIHRCLMKYVIDDMYRDCDGIDPTNLIDLIELDSLDKSNNVLDSTELINKTTRI